MFKLSLKKPRKAFVEKQDMGIHVTTMSHLYHYQQSLSWNHADQETVERYIQISEGKNVIQVYLAQQGFPSEMRENFLTRQTKAE
jgi:hypothetical protein